MQTGDLVFVRGHSLLSRLITLFDKGKWSHVAVAVSDTEIIEAAYFTKVRIRKMEYKDYEIAPMNLTFEEQKTIVELAKKLEGKWYDYKQILWYVLRNLFKVEKSPFWNNPNDLICSELVFILYSSIGKTYGDSFVTPNELYHIITNNREK